VEIGEVKGENVAYCPKCGEMNDERATFCMKCGSVMAAPSEPVRKAPATFMQTRFDRTFKVGGPLIKTFLGMIFLLLIIEISRALSGGSDFAGSFAEFLNDSLLLFFLIILLSSYSGYLSRSYPREHSALAPLIAAVVVTFYLWVVANVFDLLGASDGNETLSTMGDLLFSILYIIFLLILLLGYIGVIMRSERIGPVHRTYPAPPSTDGPSAQPMAGTAGPQPAYYPGRRLGRSSQNKIIAGVCGGMAEHFNSDPFIIRVLWVIGAILSLGTFVLVYLILAIVLPKNR